MCNLCSKHFYITIMDGIREYNLYLFAFLYMCCLLAEQVIYEGNTNDVFLELQRTHLEHVYSKWKLLSGKGTSDSLSSFH
jgi:hypothetical protein